MKTTYVIFSIFSITIMLVGCHSVPQNEGVPATVAEVINKIKGDLSKYQEYDEKIAAIAPLDNACHGVVGFYIENVKVTLTTQTDDTNSTSSSATLPVGSGTLGLNFGMTREVKGTQNLTFMLYPKVSKAAVPVSGTIQKISPELFPIAASLQRLRDGLLEASDTKPCVALIPPEDDKGKITDPGGTFVFGFTVIKQSSSGAALKFVIFSLGTNSTSQGQVGNTITVSYKARTGTSAIL